MYLCSHKWRCIIKHVFLNVCMLLIRGFKVKCQNVKMFNTIRLKLFNSLLEEFINFYVNTVTALVNQMYGMM